MLRFSSSVERCPARLAQPSSPTTNIRHDQSCYFGLGQDLVNSPPTGSLLTGSKNSVDSPVLSENILAEDKEDGDMEEDSRKQRTKDSLDCTSMDEEQETATLMPSAPCGASQSPPTNAPQQISDISVGQDSANSSVLYDFEEENFDNQESVLISDKERVRIHAKYTLCQKKRIVSEAFSKERNVRATARKYKIAHGSIYHWRGLFERASLEKQTNVRLAELHQHGVISADYQRFEQDREQFGVYGGEQEGELAGNKLSYPAGRRCQIPDWACVHLARYFDMLRSYHQRVSINDLCTEYMTICPEETEDLSFSAVRQRVYRWTKVSKIVNRAVTHEAQKGDYCSKRMNDWIAFIRQQIAVYNVKHENVVNFDETNVDFTLKAKRTLNRKGAKSVLQSCASSSSRATVMLGASMTGMKFPAYVIFKAKRGGKIAKTELAKLEENGYPSGLLYSVQGNAWMDEDGMHDWINRVWEPYVKSKTGDDIFLLILDEFRGHVVSSVMQRFGELRTLVEIIPGGYTGKLQVMDVGVNRPFKSVYANEYSYFVRISNERNIPGTRVYPTHQDVSNWIDCPTVSCKSILKTWWHIGIWDHPLRPIDVLDDIEETRVQLGMDVIGN